MTTATESQVTALETLKGFYNYAEGASHNWHNIHFTEAGKCRLSATIGWLNGLNMAGMSARAEQLAAKLVEQLTYLNNYGGLETLEDEEGSGRSPITFPRYRVVLSDDGGHGSFGILWYSAVVGYQIVNDTCKRMDPELYENNDGENWNKYLRLVDSAKRQLGINDNLELTRLYRYREDGPYYHERILYRFRMNGAMILHAPQHVNLCHWSIHT